RSVLLVEAINQDRYDDPIGPQHGAFAGSYGTDPDGPNDNVDVATDFSPAAYVNEPRLTITYNDTDWFTWTAQATGQMSVGVLFNAAQGQLGFTMYADTNGNGSLDPAELAAPVAAGMTAADGLHTSGISAAKGERFWVQVFGIVESGNTIPDKNVYT